MTAPTHIAFGLLTVASSFSLFSMSIHRNLPAIAGAIIGSLLPDVDSPRSYIGRMMLFASIPIERRWGHRTITHSLLCMFALSVVTLPLLAYQTACYTGHTIRVYEPLDRRLYDQKRCALVLSPSRDLRFPWQCEVQGQNRIPPGGGYCIGRGCHTAPLVHAHIA